MQNHTSMRENHHPVIKPSPTYFVLLLLLLSLLSIFLLYFVTNTLINVFFNFISLFPELIL